MMSPAVKARLAQFKTQTLPLMAYFADARKLRSVSASAGPEQVYEQIRKVVRSLGN